MDYLFWAYTLVWVLLFAYIMRLIVKQKRMAVQVEQLNRKIDELNDKMSDSQENHSA